MNFFHKRMDYVIREVARMAQPRPHLDILGERWQAEAVEESARAELGSDGATLRTVPREQLVDYYDAADAFILASLREGFGLVYIEALGRGLTCVAHDTPHTRDLLRARRAGRSEQAGKWRGCPRSRVEPASRRRRARGTRGVRTRLILVGASSPAVPGHRPQMRAFLAPGSGLTPT